MIRIRPLSLALQDNRWVFSGRALTRKDRLRNVGLFVLRLSRDRQRKGFRLESNAC